MPLELVPAKEWRGIRKNLWARQLASGSGARMVLFRVKAGTEVEQHIHPHAQLGVIMDGTGIHRIGTEELTLKPGDSYYIPPNLSHGFRASEEGDVVLLDVDWLPVASLDADLPGLATGLSTTTTRRRGSRRKLKPRGSGPVH